MWSAALSREAPGKGVAVTDAQENIENIPATLTELTPPKSGDWVGVGTGPLPVEAAWRWAILPGCGGIVTFCGTVRDHSDGPSRRDWLEYEAYVEQVAPRLTRVAAAARERGERSAAWCCSTESGGSRWERCQWSWRRPHPIAPRPSRRRQFCIDTLKHTVPIWKRETWSGGTDWTLCSAELDAAPPNGAHVVSVSCDRPGPRRRLGATPSDRKGAAATMPLEGPLVDRYGRVHDDLRISVTDRCNFRCVYCMPEEGMTFLPHSDSSSPSRRSPGWRGWPGASG